MPETKRPLKVFLCHAHSDKEDVRVLYERLVNGGVDAWLDKEKLLPGQDWELEIRKAVRASDVILVCLSKQFNQAGFRQKEVRLALDTAMEKPDGEIFIIPTRLEVCENLESLKKWHQVDLFEENGYDILLRALRARADGTGTTLRRKKSSIPKTSSPSLKLEKSIEQDQSAGSSPGTLLAKKEHADAHVKTPGVPSVTPRKAFKLKTEYIVALIGAVATILAAVISSPLIERWLTPIASPTMTVPTQVEVPSTEPSALILPSETVSPNSDFQRGSTVQHQVTAGESLLQIARCYGVDFEQLRTANPQISDPRSFLPGMTVTVPNIGSAGEIYGPPCVAYYIVQSGDTWQSIANLYKADLAVLRAINQDDALEVGQLLIIPSNPTLATPPPSSKLLTLAPHQEVPYSFSIPQGQEMTVKITVAPSNASVALLVDDRKEEQFKNTDDVIVWGSPSAESGSYVISILNKTSSTITYRLEIDLSG